MAKRAAAVRSPASEVPIEPRVIDMPPLSLRADIAASSINDEARTVDLIFATVAPVMRYDWMGGEKFMEILSMEPGNVRLDRLNQGGPLLDTHSAWSVTDQLGAVVPGSVSLTKKEARATVRFSKREAVQAIWEDVKDGIIRSVSVGYKVYKFEETAPSKSNALPVRKAVDWEPFEISMVPIPADVGAMSRGAKPADTNPCQVVSTRNESKEQAMPEETRSETIVEDDPLAPPAKPAADPPAEPTEVDLAVEVERQRCEGIYEACTIGRLPRAFASDLIKRKVVLGDARGAVLAEISKRGGDDRGPGRVPSGAAEAIVGDDPLVHVRAGVVGALLNRVAPDRFNLDDAKEFERKTGVAAEAARQYRGMSLLDIGRGLLNNRGVRTTRMSRSDLVEAILGRAGYHTTSDFPTILEDVARKNLRSAYEAAPQTWLPLAKPVNLSDFKPSRQVQLGDAPGLDEVLEHGEFTHGTITEGKETIQLKTYGKIFGITRQALINDDLNAFGEVPAAFGRKARDKESDLAWAQITANGLMGDGVALFSVATHANLTTGPGTVIAIASLGVGRAAIRKQKGLDGVTPLNLSPRYLIVPAALETIADQYVTQITPAQGSNVNPFSAAGRTPLTVIVEPRLDAASATAWYMASPMDQAPLLYYGTLDGQSGPDLRQEEGFTIDGVKFRCRIDVAFKAADWRAAYKNDGA